MAALETSVVHLAMRFRGLDVSNGTGFLYERNGKLFIITAWHNVTGRHSETLACLSDKATVPDDLVATVQVRIKSGGSIGLQPFRFVVPLADSDKAVFYIHPQSWPRVDVVAIPFDIDTLDFELHGPGQSFRQPFRSFFPEPSDGSTSVEICPFQRFALSNQKLEEEWLQTVEVTEELFIPGYPQNVQADFSRPVWKRATIASSIQLGRDRQPQFLIDSASHHGMSGSPVVFYSPGGTIRVGGTTTLYGYEITILAGVYVGRIGIVNGVDPQIGTVWHRSVIDVIIDGQRFERLPEDIEAPPSERAAAVRKMLGTCSKEGVESVKNPDFPSRYYIRREVMEELHGRASPAKVLEELLEAAQTYDGPYTADDEETKST